VNNIIKLINGLPEIVDDKFQLVEQIPTVISEDSYFILPFKQWLAEQTEPDHISPNQPKVAVWLENTDEVATLAPWLDYLSLIALEFPKFTDGRAYSQATELRRHLNWQGELRAVGDVLRDQLSHMRLCGFDSFALREDKNSRDAIKSLQGISIIYGRSVAEPLPLYRRRYK
jgi:uncharacterized protein (DUF934 family)